MPNRTIYVSESDASLFEEAKTIAGEALSSVIARALREYVSRHQKKTNGMKEIAVRIGPADAQREQRFNGIKAGEWNGFSDDKQWWLTATIYRTQKNNWAVYLTTVCKASLLTDKRAWKASGDYLINPSHSALLVSAHPHELKTKLPHQLYLTLLSLSDKYEKPIEYLDI
jgi:EXLDI family protein